jgi:cytochrome c553
MIARIAILSLALTATATMAETAPATKPDLAKAKQIAEQVCVACHTADGNSVNPIYPKLASQHPEYIYKQLHNFKSWNGKSPERNNPIMLGMTATLSEADMKGLAAYFSQQKQKPDVAKNKQTIELGQRIWRAGNAATGVPACAGCHGPTGAGLPAQYPRLQGQFADYTEAQLKAFRSGDRSNDLNSAMRTVAVRLTDPEMKAVADYIAGLR